MPPDPRAATWDPCSQKLLIAIIIPVILILVSSHSCRAGDSSSSLSTFSKEESSPSLFDSLPLNGALIINDVNLPVLERNPLGHFKNRSQLVKVKRRIKPGSRRRQLPSSPVETGEGVKSLFDLLPDQGAMLSESEHSSSLDKGLQEGNSNPRNQRSSSSKHFDDNKDHRQVFEIEHQKPTSEFSLSFFNSKVLPPILKSLTQNDKPSHPPSQQQYSRIPVFSSPSVHLVEPERGTFLGPFPLQGSSGPSGAYGPPPPHSYHPPPHPPPPQYYNKVSNAVKDHYNNNKATPSVGSTVYIYGGSHQNQPNSGYLSPPHPPPRHTYGPPPLQTTTTTTTPQPPKNEIHYHYHINKNTEDKPKQPDIVYGVPHQSNSEQNNAYKDAPLRARRPGGGNRQYANNYGPPPPPPSKNKGYPSSKPQQSGYEQDQQQVSQSGYGSSQTTSPPSHPQGPSQQQSQVVPILSVNRRKNVKSFRNSDLTDQDDYDDDYTNDRGTEDTAFDNTPDEDRFKSRTLLTLNRAQYQPPPPQQQDNPPSNYGPPPSNSYGHPQQQQQYGPPPQQQYGPQGQQQQQYGPPSSTQPPTTVNDEPRQPIQSQSAQTSITIETIPITTTETRLVTVPKITQTLGGSQQIIPQFDQGVNHPPPPGGGYGNIEPPAPPPPQSSNNPGSSTSTPSQQQQQQQHVRNLLNEQLLQLTPSRGGLPDFTDIETLALLQSSQQQRHNPLLTDLLLSQVQNSQLNNLRGGGQHGSLYSASNLRNAIILNNHVNHPGLRNVGGVGVLGGSGLGSHGLTVNNLPFLGTGVSQGNLIGNLRGGGTVLTGDAVGAISDLIREQKLQQAVSDLRSRLRYQNRDAERTRQNYRSLFYKGALLLAGLSLIPTVATVASPGVAGLAAAAALGHTTSSLSLSSLLPLTTGRRRRRRDTDDLVLFPDMRNLTLVEKKDKSFHMDPRVKSRNFINSTNKSLSLFDFMAFKGALIPVNILTKDLEKYLPPAEIMKNSQCLQKYFCQNLLQIERLANPTPLLLLLAGLSSDVDKNPWLREAMTAAKNNSCLSFYCYHASKGNKKRKKLSFSKS